jgi:DNA-binding beta-propeller fold protein YncE
MSHRLLSFSVALVLLVGVAPAQADPVLYGALSGPTTSGPLAGSILTIDTTTGMGTIIGVPISGTGITGLAVDNLGRLLGTTSEDGGPPRLVHIDPATGGLISVLASLTFGGSPQPVTDLAFDPTTNTLYANGAFGPVTGNDALLSIDMTTGATTLVGRILTEGGFKALASTDGGTLYSISTFGTSLYTLDPTDASILGSVGLGAASGIGALGMTVRSSDGQVFFTNGDFPFGRDLWMIDPDTGGAVLVGSIGISGNVHDLAFVDVDVVVIPEPSSLALLGIGGVLGLLKLRRFVRRN